MINQSLAVKGAAVKTKEPKSCADRCAEPIEDHTGPFAMGEVLQRVSSRESAPSLGIYVVIHTSYLICNIRKDYNIFHDILTNIVSL